jgi:hypothetical protein
VIGTDRYGDWACLWRGFGFLFDGGSIVEFRIKFRDRDNKWRYARFRNREGKVCRFLKRQFAVQWCRNNRMIASFFYIIGEDGSVEVLESKRMHVF